MVGSTNVNLNGGIKIGYNAIAIDSMTSHDGKLTTTFCKRESCGGKDFYCCLNLKQVKNVLARELTAWLPALSATLSALPITF